VKLAWNRALAVGVLAAVTGVGFLVALTFFRKGGYSERDSYLVHAAFSDATGLTWRSRVQIAGIQVGEVTEIELVNAKARLGIRVKKGIDLRTDACLTKTFPSALLPDALLEAIPGSPSKPTLASLPEEQREITCVREATSVQQLLDSMSKIAADVQLVTGELAGTVGGDKGLREIVENLASATKRVDETLAENQANINRLVSNVRDFTGDLREISHRDKDKIGRIVTNVEQLTAQLKVMAASLQEIIDPGSVKKHRGEVDPPQNVKDAVAAASFEEREGAADQARGVRQAVDKLTSSLDKLDQIMTKVSEGKSVAGRLLVDERLGRKVGGAAEEYADYVDRIFKLQIQLQLRSEWLLNQTIQSGRPGTKLYFGARLLPRPDKYYLIEVVSDPRGVDTVTTQTTNTQSNGGAVNNTVTTTRLNEDKLTFSLQIAKRYGPVTFRVGIIEGSGGAGADLHVFKDRLQLSTSIYQFSRAFQSGTVVGTTKPVYPRAKVFLNYYFLDNFFLTTGVDDFLNRWQQGQYPGGRSFNVGTDVFFGGGLFFTDDDIKTLLGAGAGSAVSAK
jgi:phospholipid/cholesterol/gamma-HCH transport system substrate-binding protein